MKRKILMFILVLSLYFNNVPTINIQADASSSWINETNYEEVVNDFNSKQNWEKVNFIERKYESKNENQPLTSLERKFLFSVLEKYFKEANLSDDKNDILSILLDFKGFFLSKEAEDFFNLTEYNKFKNEILNNLINNHYIGENSLKEKVTPPDYIKEKVKQFYIVFEDSGELSKKEILINLIKGYINPNNYSLNLSKSYSIESGVTVKKSFVNVVKVLEGDEELNDFVSKNKTKIENGELFILAKKGVSQKDYDDIVLARSDINPNKFKNKYLFYINKEVNGVGKVFANKSRGRGNGVSNENLFGTLIDISFEDGKSFAFLNKKERKYNIETGSGSRGIANNYTGGYFLKNEEYSSDEIEHLLHHFDLKKNKSKKALLNLPSYINELKESIKDITTQNSEKELNQNLYLTISAIQPYDIDFNDGIEIIDKQLLEKLSSLPYIEEFKYNFKYYPYRIKIKNLTGKDILKTLENALKSLENVNLTYPKYVNSYQTDRMYLDGYQVNSFDFKNLKEGTVIYPYASKGLDAEHISKDGKNFFKIEPKVIDSNNLPIFYNFGVINKNSAFFEPKQLILTNFDGSKPFVNEIKKNNVYGYESSISFPSISLIKGVPVDNVVGMMTDRIKKGFAGYSGQGNEGDYDQNNDVEFKLGELDITNLVSPEIKGVKFKLELFSHEERSYLDFSSIPNLIQVASLDDSAVLREMKRLNEDRASMGIMSRFVNRIALRVTGEPEEELPRTPIVMDLSHENFGNFKKVYNLGNFVEIRSKKDVIDEINKDLGTNIPEPKTEIAWTEIGPSQPVLPPKQSIPWKELEPSTPIKKDNTTPPQTPETNDNNEMVQTTKKEEKVAENEAKQPETIKKDYSLLRGKILENIKDNIVDKLPKMYQDRYLKHLNDYRQDYKYFRGYPDNSMKPEQIISRQELAEVLNRILFEDDKTQSFQILDKFIDEIPTWSAPAIANLTKNGLYHNELKFLPHDLIDWKYFEDLSNIIIRLMKDK